MTTLDRLRSYRENEAWSQSDLKKLLSGKSNRWKPTLPSIIGGHLDCVLLTSEITDDLYYACDVDRPTQTIIDLCNSLYGWLDQTTLLMDACTPDLLEHFEEIEQWIDTEDYYKNRPKTRVKKFIEEASEWWKVLVEKGEKEIITTSEQLDNELICMRLKDDPELDWLWQGEFQKDFYWEEEGIRCKGLGDICLEDCYVDLKYTTCNSINDWIKVCSSLNYPFQMAFYKSGLGFKKGYWLVTNKDWHQLVEVTPLMFSIGKFGYRKREVLRIDKEEISQVKKIPGYLDGLNILNGNIPIKTIEQMYLENLV